MAHPRPSRGMIRSSLQAPLAARLVVGLFVVWLAYGNDVTAQTVPPPPGFSPGSIDDPNEVPPSPTQQFKGSSDSDPFGATVLDRPLTKGTTQDDRFSEFPPRARAYRVRDPMLVFADDERPMPRFWFRAEALLWWSKSSPIPVPLVTVGDLSDTLPGAIGQPGTTVVLGNQNIGLPVQGGERYTLGFSFDQEQKWGLEGTYFDLQNVYASSGVTSSGSYSSALLTFPFFNPTIPGEDSAPISMPGSFAGTAIVSTRSFLQGADINFVHNQIVSRDFN